LVRTPSYQVAEVSVGCGRYITKTYIGKHYENERLTQRDR
jgi:hypothetical protein